MTRANANSQAEITDSYGVHDNRFAPLPDVLY